MRLAHLGQEGGAGVTVGPRQIGGARESEMKLRRRLDALAQVAQAFPGQHSQAPRIGLCNLLPVIAEVRRRDQCRHQ